MPYKVVVCMFIDYALVAAGFFCFDKWASYEFATLWLFICYALLLHKYVLLKHTFSHFLDDLESKLDQMEMIAANSLLDAESGDTAEGKEEDIGDENGKDEETGSKEDWQES